MRPGRTTFLVGVGSCRGDGAEPKTYSTSSGGSRQDSGQRDSRLVRNVVLLQVGISILTRGPTT